MWPKLKNIWTDYDLTQSFDSHSCERCHFSGKRGQCFRVGQNIRIRIYDGRTDDTIETETGERKRFLAF